MHSSLRVSIPLLCLLLPGLCSGAQIGRPSVQRADKVDPTSLKLSAALYTVGLPGSTPVIKPGTPVTIRCDWHAKFVKPAVLHAPLQLNIVFAEETNKIIQLHKTTAFVKAGNYSFPGPAGQGQVTLVWKPQGFGNHKVGCMVTTANAAWWGQGALPLVKAYRQVQIEPDQYKICPPIYPVQITKSPKGDQSGAAGSVTPTEVALSLNTAQAMGNQFVCHYRSKSNDIPDVLLTVPCPGAKPLPATPGQFLKTLKFYCSP